VAARVLRSFLQRLEKVPTASGRPVESPKGRLPVWIGNAVAVGGHGDQPWQLPLGIAGHMFISGKTGAGKSFAGRTVCEGAASHGDLAILILDPRDQWIGVLRPEDRPGILERYKQFGLEHAQARSFDFTYHGVGRRLGAELPDDLGKLTRGRHIVSFKGMDDEARCDHFADILDAVFEACTRRESDLPRVLVMVEEVPVFMKKGVVPEAREAAQRSEQSIDRAAREGRKYGIALLLIGQSSKDLSHAMATVRQNISTRIFMNNSDRELEYVADWLDDPKAIISLPPGEAFVCNPRWGTARGSIRPPLSKVWELDDREIRKILGQPQQRDCSPLSKNAQAVLGAAREQYQRDGQPVRFAPILERLGITSRRRIRQIVAELEGASLATFEQLPERGGPLVMILARPTDSVR